MPRWCVTFYKTISDDTGHEHRAVQKELTVLAEDRDAAIEEAERLYVLAERCDWRLRADAVVAEEA
ncbi:hypothetical protein [Salinarimonas rosea]|uniref:hypothetical protein n=1 Tax=Salinarimonas rosea TaxID=552063 RepID=UPI0003FC4072|nr:hypothetical protein [Salinarimonas rosea]